MTSTAEDLPGISLDTLSESLRGFYVPQFEIRVEGAGLPGDVMRDVIELTYEDDLDKMDSFQITLSNWDEVTKEYKYIGSEDETALGGESGSTANSRYQLFEPCSKQVKISMGYLGTMKPMITGFFTTMEPSFTGSAPATLAVRGINILQRLRTKKYADFFTGLKPSEIARQIGQRRDRDLNALRFPARIVTNDEAMGNEDPIDHIAQKNEYDIDFLWKLARRYGYVISTIEPEQEGGQIGISFGPSIRGEAMTDAVYDLKLRQSLIDFKPRITTANQFRSVTVNGWNRRTQRAIHETVSFEDREMQRLNADLRYLVCMCDAREELVVDEPVFNERDAKRRATALLLDQQKQMVKVSATTIGLPLLKAGTNVRISEVGARLSGLYFVTKTQHIFNNSGYITQFEARRESIPSSGEGRPCAPH
jgi:phage protein D